MACASLLLSLSDHYLTILQLFVVSCSDYLTEVLPLIYPGCMSISTVNFDSVKKFVDTHIDHGKSKQISLTDLAQFTYRGLFTQFRALTPPEFEKVITTQYSIAIAWNSKREPFQYKNECVCAS